MYPKSLKALPTRYYNSFLSLLGEKEGKKINLIDYISNFIDVDHLIYFINNADKTQVGYVSDLGSVILINPRHYVRVLDESYLSDELKNTIMYDVTEVFSDYGREYRNWIKLAVEEWKKMSWWPQ